MNGILSLVTFLLVSGVIPMANAVDARTSTHPQSVRSARCFNDTELRDSITTLKQQGGADVVKVSESLLTKAKTGSQCRIVVVQGLISSMAQGTNPTTNQYENFFLWLHGASLLADLKGDRSS